MKERIIIAMQNNWKLELDEWCNLIFLTTETTIGVINKGASLAIRIAKELVECLDV